MTTLDPLRYDAKPKGIDVGADGTPWFAEADAGNPGYRIGTAKGASGYTEYSGAVLRRFAVLGLVHRRRA